MTKRKLLIASVFGPSDRNLKWLQLQQKFIKDTTSDFDYAVCLDRISPNLFDTIIIPSKEHYDSNASVIHCDKLNVIIEYALTKEYDSLLILDSDAFPINKNWESSLLKKMTDHDVAAVIRFENLDTFPHPSIHFAKNRTAIQKLKFRYVNNTNMLGVHMSDSSSNVKRFYPLIRTNKINPHPILYGIYANMFYHHGAGTRPKKEFRGMNYHAIKTDPVEESIMFDYLAREPNSFIQKLQENKTSEFQKMQLLL